MYITNQSSSIVNGFSDSQIIPFAPSKLEVAMNASVFPAKYQNIQVLQNSPPIDNMGVTDLTNPDNAPFGTGLFLNDNGVGFLPDDGVGFLSEDGTERVSVHTKANGKFHMVRVPLKNEGVDTRAAFVDQVTFTVRMGAVLSRKIYAPYDLDAYGQFHGIDDAIPRISSILLDIFGFGVSHKRDFGMNHYKTSYHLGGGYGLLGIGGQNDTINIQIFGKGVMMARDGWNKKLYNYLTILGDFEAYITRIDLATDFFKGQYTPDIALQDYKDKKFSLTNKRPSVEQRGDWVNEDDEAGRTLYVGKREGGKMVRVYEKYKQIMGIMGIEGVTEGHRLFGLLDWCRVEVEWHRKHRILPPEMLINEGQYLAASYPALGFISDIQQKVLTIKKKVVATVERAINIVKHQFGKTIYALIQLEGVEVIKKLITEDVPKWAKAFDVPPVATDDQWESWEKQMALIPF